MTVASSQVTKDKLLPITPDIIYKNCQRSKYSLYKHRQTILVVDKFFILKRNLNITRAVFMYIIASLYKSNHMCKIILKFPLTTFQI